jgi:hypothetical protein
MMMMMMMMIMKMKKFSPYVMGRWWIVIAVFIERLFRKSTEIRHEIFSEGKDKKASCHLAHNDNFSSYS